uniref:Major capsid protein N-terminal domain-containing protein n=1 Tax=viral metagenome TaxID=1070528 RepID=A0A6C0K5H7_9ZZZZ
MASERSGALMEGSLYESIARGNKDTYFFSKTLQDAVNPFETRYERRPAFLNELRRNVPLNSTDFGRSCEFEFEVAGELFLESTILIDLPTWLPPDVAAKNGEWNYYINTPNTSRTYGYTRGIAYFLFSNIQIFQDKVLLYETSGDSLWASELSHGSLNSAWLTQALSGQLGFDSDTRDLSRQATPGRLRLKIPIPGNSRGLPTCAMKQQKFRLKLTLRTLEECVECSDDSVVHPAPWSESAFQIVDRTGGPTTTFAPLPRELIGKPILTLETRHVYMDAESREEYETQKHEIPYSLLYENTYTFSGAFAIQVVKNIDAEHPASRMFWYIRTWDNLYRNRRWATADYRNPYYGSATFLIAGRDRETAAGPILWNTLVPFAKEERDPGFGLGEMNWDLGPGIGRDTPHVAVPEGSINFSTAEKPAFSIFLRYPNIASVFDTKTVELNLIVNSWVVYKIEDNRGFVAFSN